MPDQVATVTFGGLEKVKDMRPILKRAEAYFQGQYIIAFDEQGRGTKWRERSVPNLPGIISDLAGGGMIKERRWQPRPALVDTGRLKLSGGTEVIGDTMYWGSDLPYAGLHQWGGTAEIQNPLPDKMPDKKISRGLRQMKNKGYEKEAEFLMITKKWKIQIPARPFLEVLQKDYDAVYEIIYEEMGK